MNDEYKYMSELFRIISGALRLDTVKVRNYVQFLADKLDGDGDTSTANRLRKLLDETDHQLRPTNISVSQSVPVDPESRFSLLEKVNLKASAEEPLVLTVKQQSLIDEFVSVAKCQGEFEAQGVNAAATLLLYGPPGCGKSRIARHIARSLGRDLYLAKLDGLISSFLGNTSKNIRSIFEFAYKNPSVLLLDEFDAIAKLRDDKQELGELKRVVTSFLQNLDSIGFESIVIAATNHHTLLDPAVWRRFSYSIEVGYPAPHQRRVMWKEFSGDLPISTRDINVLCDLSEGFSGSEIRDVCLRLKRQRILNKPVQLLKDAFVGLLRIASGQKDRERFLSQFEIEDEGPTLARKLKERNAKLYSHAQIAALIGTSKATAHRWQMKET